MSAAAFFAFVSPLLLGPPAPNQAGDAAGPSWDKIVTALESRIRGADLPDRVRATQEAVATKDARAFELLARTYFWADGLKKGMKGGEDQAKKALAGMKDDHASKTKERNSLVAKKKHSSGDLERIQALNGEIAGLNQSMQSLKASMEKTRAEHAILEQVAGAAQQGFATLLRSAAPGMYEKYRKALAAALDFPGALSQAPLFVQALVQSGRKEGFSTLEEILKNALGSEALFMETAKGMTALGGKEGVSSLIQFLAFPNSSVRKAAHEALKAATGQSLPLDKSAWEKWQKSSQG